MNHIKKIYDQIYYTITKIDNIYIYIDLRKKTLNPGIGEGNPLHQMSSYNGSIYIYIYASVIKQVHIIGVKPVLPIRSMVIVEGLGQMSYHELFKSDQIKFGLPNSNNQYVKMQDCIKFFIIFYFL